MRPRLPQAVAAALLLAAPEVAPAQAPDPAVEMLPAPDGSYAVGRRFEDWTDADRIDPLAPEPNRPRRLPVTIWYPAQVNGEDGTSPYFPQSFADHFPVQAGQGTHAIDGAALGGNAGERFAVLLLKSAFGFLSLQHSVIAESLASHGYIVVGSDSPYTTPLVVFGDGSTVARTPVGAGRSTENKPDPLAPAERNGATLVPFAQWVADNRFLADRLARLDEDDPLFAGRLDLTRIGALGHSYGGAAALEFCRADARCKAAVDIDGAVLGEVVTAGSAKPSLFLWSDRPVLRVAVDERPPKAIALLDAVERISAGLPNRPNQLLLQTAGHFSFTDTALFVTDERIRTSGVIGTIDPVLALAITNDVLTSFFDAELKGAASPTLADIAAAQPELIDLQAQQ